MQLLARYLDIGRSSRSFGRARGDGRVKLQGALVSVCEALAAFDKDHGGWFKTPVDVGLYPTYAELVPASSRMDLATLRMRVDAQYYSSALDFAADVRLIHAASLAFNGAEVRASRILKMRTLWTFEYSRVMGQSHSLIFL